MTTVGRDDEDDLAARFRSGDEAALHEAYRRWAPLVFRLARQALGTREDADDVTQAVFVSAWLGRAGFDPERGALGGWIVGITKHRIADVAGATARRVRLDARLRADPSSTARADAVDPAQTAMIEEELARLEEVPRRVVELSYYSGLSHSQIADELGLPLGTVKSHLRRSIARIRSDWEVEDDAR